MVGWNILFPLGHPIVVPSYKHRILKYACFASLYILCPKKLPLKWKVLIWEETATHWKGRHCIIQWSGASLVCETLGSIPGTENSIRYERSDVAR